MRLRYSLVVTGGLAAILLGCGGRASKSGHASSGGSATSSATGGSVPADTGGNATGGSSGGGAPPSGGRATGGGPTSGGTDAGGGKAGGTGGVVTAGSAGSEAGIGGAIVAGAGGSTAAGGAAGQGGSDETAGAAGFAAGVAVAECSADEDCTLQNDCCTCQAVPVGVAQPACGMACANPRCDEYGPDVAARCYRGFCVLDISCERWELTCSDPEPACAPGRVPAVVDGCWGPCIDARECPSVPSCDYCAEGDVCLNNALLGTTIHCIEVPNVCAARPDCSCLGEAVCLAICTDTGPDELTCICPGC
jgi:hypothetical protein